MRGHARDDKLGLVMIQSAASLTDANFGTGTGAPTTSTFNDVALYGTYNVDDSLFTANYAATDTIYARGNYFTGNIPAGSKILFKSKDQDAFIGGYQNTGGSKDVFQGRTTMFSSLLKGGGIVGKPVQSVAFGANMFYRPHYQKYYPILATAIFAGAAGILDDQIDPDISSIAYNFPGLQVAASDEDSGIAAYELYKRKADTKEYDFIARRVVDGMFSLTASGENRYMIVVTDHAGNKDVEKFTYIDGNIIPYTERQAPAPFTLTFRLNNDGKTYTATIPAVENGLYSFDGITYSGVNTKVNCKPETDYTGYLKYWETDTQYESAAVSDTQTAPKLPVKPGPSGGSGSSETVSPPVVPPETGSILNPFNDVMAGDWFNNAVQYAYEKGLMQGTSVSPMLFSPHATTTRAMVVAILYRMEGMPAMTAANPFSDVATGQYYADAVTWASEKGIVAGYNKGIFGPGNSITREQMAVILMNYAKFKGYDVSARADLSGFGDAASVSGWALDALSWANAKGLIQGSGNQLMPAGNAERAQVAAILQRFAEIYTN